MSREAVYLLALVAFVTAVRSRLPWTRAGGVLWLLGVSAVLAGVLARTGTRELLLEPGRLPAAVFLVLAAAALWWSMRREQGRAVPSEPVARPATPSRILGVAAAILAVTAAARWLAAPAAGASAGVPWFLAGLDLLLLDFPPWFVHLALPAAALGALLLAPLLDSADPEVEGPFGGRRDEVPFFLFAWLFVGALPIALAIFGPPATARPAAPLSERFWIDLLGLRPPAAWGWRELPGLLLLAVLAWLVVRLPEWKTTRGVFGRHRRRLGSRRYLAVMALAACFVAVPLKMAVRWLLGVGPWLDVPEIGFHF